MPTPREAAVDAVKRQMSQQQVSAAEVARRAELDYGTVADFISGRRWPRFETRSAIERALNMGPGFIDSVVRSAAGGPDDMWSVSPDEHGVLLDLPESALAGLSPAEREEVIAAAKATALRVAREIRRDLDEQGR